MPDPVLAYIALGSNLGERKTYLDQALALLRQTKDVAVTKVSSYHETEPVGGPAGQGKYLNAVAEVRTTLAPTALLGALQAVETQLGRVRAERDGPRTLDLDLLLYGCEARNELNLVLPHPRMHERLFVLEPLAEIAPQAVHPILHSTAKDLLERLRTGSQRALAGQTAVVTGSTSGIGRAIAHRLARDGARVIIHGRRSRDQAERVAQECRQHSGGAEVLMADLRVRDRSTELVEQAWRMGPIDIWVNAAGADTLTGEAAKWPFERKLEELWAVDVQATMLLSRSVGSRMKERGTGVIVTVGWDQADTGMEGDSGQLFAATKGAVMAFTKCLALTLAPEVRVNNIAPGWIRTAWGEQASAAWQERVRRETPLQRWGVPEDVAEATHWVVSPAARYITGQVIRVNGGAVRA